mmetsp:Transcript_11491/g.18689  ORF Transcript_11491/g.18689 Transcript_11491/m.18689 type:complete len:283 (-) Transcript_11491:63-911(-)
MTVPGRTAENDSIVDLATVKAPIKPEINGGRKRKPQYYVLEKTKTTPSGQVLNSVVAKDMGQQHVKKRMVLKMCTFLQVCGRVSLGSSRYCLRHVGLLPQEPNDEGNCYSKCTYLEECGCVALTNSRYCLKHLPLLSKRYLSRSYLEFGNKENNVERGTNSKVGDKPYKSVLEHSPKIIPNMPVCNATKTTGYKSIIEGKQPSVHESDVHSLPQKILQFERELSLIQTKSKFPKVKNSQPRPTLLSSLDTTFNVNSLFSMPHGSNDALTQQNQFLSQVCTWQ